MNEFRQAFDAFAAGRMPLDALERELNASLTRQPQMAAAHSAYVEAMYRSSRIPGEVYLALTRVITKFSEAQPKVTVTPTTGPAAGGAASPAGSGAAGASATGSSAAPASDKTQFRVRAPAKPAAPDAAGDKTQFRAPRAPAPSAPASAAPASAAPASASPGAPAGAGPSPAGSSASLAGDKTQFRAPRVPPSPSPTTGAPPPGTSQPGVAGARETSASGLADLVGSADAASIAAASAPPSSPTGDSSWSPPTGSQTGSQTGSTSSGFSRASSWSEAARLAASGEGTELKSGDVIKERFVLEEELGRGGMGIVFKARDLRKEEAQDRRPHVALKVLNEEFKRHPESLRALQRESRKAQNLAHPNIVSVYDFDRDGANVFMVMELLEGEPLDKLIKRTEVGIGVKEALRITRDLSRAMAYAHEQGIVHSDFKPANAFLTRESVVKVFDFGIARAAKRSDNVQGSTTLFDPGTLGALTPTYASCEMIEGLEPDPRDDVYAIAVVAYELLCGQHPFNRMSAVQARDSGQIPTQPPGTTRAQWRAIQHGLSFERDRRTASAMAFLDELLPQRRTPTLYISIAAAAVAAVTIGIVLVPQWIDRYRSSNLTETLASAKEQRIEGILPKLKEMSAQERNALLSDERAWRGLLQFYDARIAAATDERRRRYDYPAAKTLLADLDGLRPDSLAVRERKDSLAARESDEIKRQRDRFDSYLQKGMLIPEQGAENIAAVLDVIRQIDAKNPLLTDPQLPGAFADSTRHALDQNNATLANALVTAGLKFDPRDATLADLRDQVQRAANARQLMARKDQLEKSIATLVGSATPPSLASFQSVRPQLVELRTVDPQSRALARAQELLHRAINDQTATLVTKHDFVGAQKVLGEYADLAATSYLDSKRQELIDARASFQQRLASLNDSISVAIRQKRMGPNVRDGAEQIMQALQQAGADPEDIALAKDRIGQAYAALATDARTRGSWDEARRYIAAGNALRPSAPVEAALQSGQHDIDEGERLAKAQLDVAQRAQLAAQRQKEDNDLRTQLTAGLGQQRLSLDDARELAGVADRLLSRGVKDAAVVNAKGTLQARVAADAIALKDAGKFDDAVKYAERANAVFPDSTSLQRTLVDLRSASVQRVALQREKDIADIKGRLDALVKSARQDDAWDASFKRELRTLEAYVPSGDAYFVRIKERAADGYLTQARSLRSAQRLTEAARMLAKAQEYAPQLTDVGAEERLLASARSDLENGAKERNRVAQIESLKQKFEVQAKANAARDAQDSLKQLTAALMPDDPYVTGQVPRIMSDMYVRIASGSAHDGRLDEAVAVIDRGRAIVPSSTALTAARELYSRYQALDQDLATRVRINTDQAKRELDTLAKLDTKEARPLQEVLARRLAARIRSESRSDVASQLATAARTIFPDSPSLVSLGGTTVVAAAATSNAPASAKGGSAEKAPAESGSRTTSVDTSRPGSQSGTAQPLDDTRQPPAAAASGSTAQVPSSGSARGNCAPNLAGYGRRAQGVCFDSFDGGRGPDLVVVPAGGSIVQPFAIGRTEVSVAEFKAYCSVTGNCPASANGPATVPITSISLADAQRYTEWLSQKTGGVYRLPTDAEWSYAANANGGAADRSSVNCVVEVNGQKLRGLNLEAVKSGATNAWGLYNSIGNAQEWVRSGTSVSVRGGAYSENVSQCTPTATRPHSGTPDALTGFRVLRELK